MSFSYSNSSIENLKDQIDIVNVIGQVVQLKKAGANFKGLCPFHNEKTPSFVVSGTKQYFTCFGCGASGDVIEFVKRYYNLEFGEAVEKLANEYGITMERSSYDDKRTKYYEVNKMAATFFYDCFTKTANKGYSYMKKRGITPQVLKKFGIGYADEKWDSLYKYLKSKGVDDNMMLELGLISQSKGKCYDRFRNRVIFPIINTSGKVIGFGGRAIEPDDNPKYLNSPESKVFQKKNNLFGLNISRQSAGKEGYIIIVEGYMDAISLYQSGITNVAASLGTALTDNQAKLVHRYTKEVILSYDADNAGRAAALRGIDILRNAGCKVRVLHVTDGKDPDEFVKKNGKPAFLKLVEGAMPYGDYKLDAAKIGFDLATDEGKIDYMKAAVGIISTMSPIEQEVYKKKLSRELNVSEVALDKEISGKSSMPQANKPERRGEDEESVEDIELSPLEKTLIKLMLINDEYVLKLAEHKDIFQSPLANKVFQLAKSEKEEKNSVDVTMLLDNLAVEDAGRIQDVLENVLIDPNQDRVFDDCISSWQTESLAKREHELIVQLSMADDESNESRVKELTDELIEVQKKRKSLQKR